MQRYLTYVFMNGILAYAIYAGYNLAGDNWHNVTLFMIWACLIFSFLANAVAANPESDETTIKAGKTFTEEPKWFKGFDFVYDVGVTLTLAYFGAFVLAVVYILHIMFTQSFKKKCLEIYNDSRSNS